VIAERFSGRAGLFKRLMKEVQSYRCPNEWHFCEVTKNKIVLRLFSYVPKFFTQRRTYEKSF
jgi:hypothetical protein